MTIGIVCFCLKHLKNLEYGLANDSPLVLPGIRTTLAQYFSTKKSSNPEKSGKSFKFVEKEDGSLVKKKMFSTPQIWLVDEKGSKKSIYLEQAQKLAEHQGLELIPLDLNSTKPLYKMIKSSEIEDSIEKHKEGKVKRFVLKTGMFENDLNSKIKHMLKLLNKGHSINVQIFSKESSAEKLDEIIDKIKTEVGCKHKMNELSSKKKSGIRQLSVLPSASSTQEKENTTEKEIAEEMESAMKKKIVEEMENAIEKEITEEKKTS